MGKLQLQYSSAVCVSVCAVYRPLAAPLPNSQTTHTAVMPRFVLPLAVLGALGVSAAAPLSSSGSAANSQVLQITPSTPAELSALISIGLDQKDHLDWWRLPSVVGEPAHLQVAPGAFRKLAPLFSNVSVMIGDLAAMVAERQAEQDAARAASRGLNATRKPEFYLDYDETIEYMMLKVAEHSDICTLSQIGVSFEGRPIYVVRVTGSLPNQPADKPELYVEAVLHAREWITAGSINWIFDEVLVGYGTDARIRDLVDSMDLTFNLVANPDGFQHSHTPTGRLWRKDRRPNAGSPCIGTDLNRNWPFGWGGPGASTNPCSDAFRGSAASSTDEVTALLGYITERAVNIRQGAFYDMHSFGNFLISPSGWTTQYPDEYDGVMAPMMSRMCDAITAVHGTAYRYDSINGWFGLATGGSIDTTYSQTGIVHSYAPELRDTGAFGFLVPFTQVTATAEETLAGILTLAETLGHLKSK
jgi:hypothetical protein